MATADPREARLPKWAQAELASLRRRLREVREDFEEFADQTTDPDRHVVVVNPHEEHPKPVAEEGQSVRFYLDGLNGYRWIDVRVPRNERRVEILASTGLRIEPSVTNHLHLSLTRD